MTDDDKLREDADTVRRMCGYLGTIPPGTSVSIQWTGGGVHCAGSEVRAIVAAAESVLPKTKMVEQWRIEYCERPNGGWRPEIECRDCERDAGHRAARLREEPTKYCCIRVTGPHMQEVPA